MSEYVLQNLETLQRHNGESYLSDRKIRIMGIKKLKPVDNPVGEPRNVRLIVDASNKFIVFVSKKKHLHNHRDIGCGLSLIHMPTQKSKSKFPVYGGDPGDMPKRSSSFKNRTLRKKCVSFHDFGTLSDRNRFGCLCIRCQGSLRRTVHEVKKTVPLISKRRKNVAKAAERGKPPIDPVVTAIREPLSPPVVAAAVPSPPPPPPPPPPPAPSALHPSSVAQLRKALSNRENPSPILRSPPATFAPTILTSTIVPKVVQIMDHESGCVKKLKVKAVADSPPADIQKFGAPCLTGPFIDESVLGLLDRILYFAGKILHLV